MITICEDLRASVLQAALQGRLVPQIEAEGNAEDLYREIQKEKEHLIKIKVIKKEKALEPIKEEEIPFDIPETWKWTRFGDLVNFRLGKTPSKDFNYWGKGFPWISIADMPEKGVISNAEKSVLAQAIKDIFKGYYSPKDTLIMSFKLSIGKVAILNMDAVHNEAIISIFPHYDMENIL